MATDLRFVEELDRDADRASELSHSGGVRRGKGRLIKIITSVDLGACEYPGKWPRRVNWRCRGEGKKA